MDSDDEDSGYILRAEREAKQNFLREEIVECDYDTELFTWYISSVGEADIDAWDFEQLQGLVRKFKNTYRSGQTLEEVTGCSQKSDLKVKQDYLIKEICDAGFEAQMFLQFIENVKGTDIGQYALDELVELVYKFKEKHRNFSEGSSEPVGLPDTTSSVIGKPSQVDNTELTGQSHVTTSTPEKGNEGIYQSSSPTKGQEHSTEHTTYTPKPIEGQNLQLSLEGPEGKNSETLNSQTDPPNIHLSPESLESPSFPNDSQPSQNNERLESLVDTDKLSIVDCSSMKETELSLESDLKFCCGSPKLRKTSFFSKKFIEYEISTQSFSWKVSRRYSDFIWLRSVLAATNPGSYVPPLPSKKIMGNFEDQFIKKRQKLLNDFLENVLRDPNLRSSPDMIVFLQESDQESFKSYRESRSKIQKPQKFEEVQTLNGDAICDYDEDATFFNLVNDYLDVSKTLEKKMKGSVKSLVSATQRLSASISDFADMVKELQKSFEQSEGFDRQSELMDSVSNALVKWAAHEEIDSRNLEDDLKLQYDFKIKEKNVLKSLLQEREVHFNSFKKLEKSKKVQPETLQNSKHFFGYFNYKIKSEFERIFTTSVLFETERLKQLSSHEINKDLSLEFLWSSTSKDFYQSPKLI